MVPTDAEAATHDAFWEDKCPKNWQTRPKNLLFYIHEDRPTLASGKPGGIEWLGRIDIHSRNLPHLMRHGLFWGQDSIRKEQGYFVCNDTAKLPVAQRTSGWKYMRKYVLKSQSSGPDGKPEWVGEFYMFSKELSVLAGIKLETWLPPAKYLVQWANAWNWEDDVVYHYRKNAPEENFNAIYDDMPMQGWWPWPRPQGSIKKGGENGWLDEWQSVMNA